MKPFTISPLPGLLLLVLPPAEPFIDFNSTPGLMETLVLCLLLYQARPYSIGLPYLPIFL